MCSKKWYLERNISCDADLLNELLETDVPWDDAIVVSVGKLRKRWDSLSELRGSLCERRLEMTVLKRALLPVKTAQFTQFFPSGKTSQSKIAQFNWECIAHGFLEYKDVCFCPPFPSASEVRNIYLLRLNAAWCSVRVCTLCVPWVVWRKYYKWTDVRHQETITIQLCVLKTREKVNYM